MKNKNKFVSVLLVIFVICTIGGIIWYKFASRPVHIPDIPNSYNLSSISYELSNGIVTVSDTDKMDKILEGLYTLNLETQSVSVQDYPVDVENLVAIRFYYKEDSVGTLYLYSKGERYYLEEPYNGLYKLSKYEYDYIVGLIKE